MRLRGWMLRGTFHTHTHTHRFGSQFVELSAAAAAAAVVTVVVVVVGQRLSLNASVLRLMAGFARGCLNASYKYVVQTPAHPHRTIGGWVGGALASTPHALVGSLSRRLQSTRRRSRKDCGSQSVSASVSSLSSSSSAQHHAHSDTAAESNGRADCVVGAQIEMRGVNTRMHAHFVDDCWLAGKRRCVKCSRVVVCPHID